MPITQEAKKRWRDNFCDEIEKEDLDLFNAMVTDDANKVALKLIDYIKFLALCRSFVSTTLIFSLIEGAITLFNIKLEGGDMEKLRELNESSLEKHLKEEKEAQ